MTTTEAPYSFNVKAIDRAGFDCMFTIRDEEGNQFFKRVTNLLNWLPDNGYTPTGKPARPVPTNGAAPPAGNAPVCQYHGPMKPSKFGGFYCPSKMGDGSYCKEKAPAAPQPAQPMPQAQAIAAANGTPPPPLFDDEPPPDDYDYYGLENN